MKPATKLKVDPLTAAVEELSACLRVIVLAMRKVAPGAISDDLEVAVLRRVRTVEALMGEAR